MDDTHTKKQDLPNQHEQSSYELTQTEAAHTGTAQVCTRFSAYIFCFIGLYFYFVLLKMNECMNELYLATWVKADLSFIPTGRKQISLFFQWNNAGYMNKPHVHEQLISI